MKMVSKHRLSTEALAGLILGFLTFSMLSGGWAQATVRAKTDLRFVQVAAADSAARSRVADTGMSIEFVRSDSVWGFAGPNSIAKLRERGIQVLGNFDATIARGGHENTLDFPPEDSKFHTYDQTLAALKDLQSKNSDITKLESLGHSLEQREIWGLHINSTPQALASGQSTKPGAVYMGAHHAREHVSVEVPLMFVDYLLKNRADPKILALLDSRDIWIIPMVNPDGAEYDISGSDYKVWRKNRAHNADGTFGVDLNRNYGFKWGTGGSSNDGSDETYMGPAPFSEPETQAIRDFINQHSNFKTLLTFHTFSELVLYPWGHTQDVIDNSRDRQVFETMAKTMAGWNHYTPEQASSLYIASGDTTDWAYGEHGIFAFTFELSPQSSFGIGGFYPGEGILDKVFADNLQPCLYLLDATDDPYKVIDGPSGFLKNYVEPSIPVQAHWETRPAL